MTAHAPPLLATSIIFCSVAVCAQTHTHGDMVGSIRTNEAVVWTRSSSPADVSVIYGTNRTLSGAAATPSFRSASASDFIAKFRLTALRPGTRYHYRTKITNPSVPSRFVLGPISTFVTAPTRAGQTTLCLIGDVRDRNHYHMFDRILPHRPDLCISLGDFPYADGANQLAEYWQKHKGVRNDARIWNFFRQLGVVATWDDHEVVNNWDANTQQVKVVNGMAAWKQYFPLLPEPAEIYHSFRWGPGVEVFVIDCRSHRGRNEDPDLPSKTMLGSAQKAWLKAALKASTATFKLICTSVPFRYGSTSTDSWDGYQRERGELLRFIIENRIRNVVLVAADQHWGSVHHLREGVREFQACPLAIGIRAPLPFADPERRVTVREINFGLIKIDALARPQTLTVELHGARGLLVRETIRADPPASVEVQADMPEASFEMSGPVLFRNSNTNVRRPMLEPGNYELTFGAIPGVPTAPSPMHVVVQPGADVRIAARWRDIPDRTHPVLLNESFEGTLNGFTIVDEGATTGPSAWFTDNGYLQQSSNIFGGSSTASNPIKPGTMALTGSPKWRDYTMTVRVRSKDNDGVGLIFRYRDQRNYYRFAWDAERKFQRLTKKVNGVVHTIAERAGGYTRHKMHNVRVTAIGRRLTVYIDGTMSLRVDDASHPAGRVGLYTWANYLTEFDDLIVRSGDVPPPSTQGFPGALFQDDFNDARLTGWTISDQGTTSSPSAWTEANGVLIQLSNIYGGSLLGTVVAKPGTMVVAKAALPSNVYFAVSLNNPDDDGMGIVFRLKDERNHYRFSWDAQRSYRRLAKVVNGRWSVIYEDAVPFRTGRSYRVATQVEGKRIRIYIDGKLWTDKSDGSHVSGTVGLYSWGSLNLFFDDVLVLKPLTNPSKDPRQGGVVIPRPAVVAQLQNGVTGIVARHAPSNGDRYLLALSFRRSPGIPLSLVNPADPRTLALAPDALFLWSLGNTPILQGFAGTIDKNGYLNAKVTWPFLPGTKGSVLYCGGVIMDRASGKFTQVIPTVKLIMP